MDAFTEMNLSDSEMNKIFGGETITYTQINEDGSVTIITVEI
jgi:hypothetical protein